MRLLDEFRVDDHPEWEKHIPILYRIAPPIVLAGAYECYNRRLTLLQTTSRSRPVSLRLPDASTPPHSALLHRDRKPAFPLPALRIDVRLPRPRHFRDRIS